MGQKIKKYIAVYSGEKVHMLKKEDLDVYRNDIEEALEPVGKKHGLKFESAGISYSDYDFTIKVHAFQYTDEVDGKAEEFKKWASHYGFQEDDYNKIVIMNGEEYRFIGFRHRANKNCCQIESVKNGNIYACSKIAMMRALKSDAE